MATKEPNKEIEQLKTELTGLKIRLRRIEQFLLSFPNIDDFTRPWDSDVGDDDMFDEAVKIVRQYSKATASLLQRRLAIGYARAARLIDLLEAKGIIGPADGLKPREVLEPKPENDDQKS